MQDSKVCFARLNFSYFSTENRCIQVSGPYLEEDNKKEISHWDIVLDAKKFRKLELINTDYYLELLSVVLVGNY